MKKMTCKQLGGACDMEFHADTFEEIAEKSKNHGMAMFQQGDAAHIGAMTEMQKQMKGPGGMNEWYETKREEFESLPEESLPEEDRDV